MPVRMPEDEIVPTAVLLLLHEPPPGDEDNVVDAPEHTVAVPVIDEGAETTVTTVVERHPPTT
jgi:hypothetical protein